MKILTVFGKVNWRRFISITDLTINKVEIFT